MTYKQISEKYNLSLRTIYNRVHALRLEGKYKAEGLDFTHNQVKQIINYNPNAHHEKRDVKNHVRKIAIVEFYIKFGGIGRVSRMLNINRAAVSNAVREFEDTGCVTVESKINKMALFEQNGNYIK